MTPIRSLLLMLVAAPWAMPAAAQTALVSDATVRSAPGGGVIAVLKSGTTVTIESARGGQAHVTFSGWIDGSKLGAAKDSFPAHLTGTIAMRLRSAPSMKGVILGEVRPGAGLHTIGRQASWANVRRSGWVDTNTLPRAAVATTKSVPPRAQPASPKSQPAPARTTVSQAKASGQAAAKPAPQAASADSAPVVEPMPDGAMRVSRNAIVRNAPNGLVIGQIAAGTIVAPLARSRGWVRVRATVWVQDKDIVPADSSFGASLSAADVRADPEGTRGKTVRWDVQVLALQRADPLRHELATDEPYFLAKGPGAEDALLYLAIPPSLLGEARSVQPLSRLLVTARVRSGRSQPVGIPILDILSFAKP
jgi:hypothetical protein